QFRTAAIKIAAAFGISIPYANVEPFFDEIAKSFAVKRTNDQPPTPEGWRRGPTLKIMHPALVERVGPVGIQFRAHAGVFHQLRGKHHKINHAQLVIRLSGNLGGESGTDCFREEL